MRPSVYRPRLWLTMKTERSRRTLAGCGKKEFPQPAPSLLSLPVGREAKGKQPFYAGCGTAASGQDRQMSFFPHPASAFRLADSRSSGSSSPTIGTALGGRSGLAGHGACLYEQDQHSDRGQQFRTKTGLGHALAVFQAGVLPANGLGVFTVIASGGWPVNNS
jgi:hypothetical protein